MTVIAFDVETSLSVPGLALPSLACGSFAWFNGDGSVGTDLLDARATLLEVRNLLRDKSITILGHNVSFDLLVCCAEMGRRFGKVEEEELIDLVFLAHHENRIRDTDFRERLIAIALGEFAEDRDYAYSLAVLAKQRLGIELDKDGGHRHTYGQLIGTPLSEWSEKHLGYAKDDAVATLKVWASQALQCSDYVVPDLADHAVWHEPHVCRKALSLYLERAWGVRTDPLYVADLERNMLAEEKEIMRDLVAAGLLVEDTKAVSRKRGAPRIGTGKYTKKQQPLKDLVVKAFTAMGREVPLTEPNHKTGKGGGSIKTDAETCEDAYKWDWGDNEELKRVAHALKRNVDYNGVTKILDTYLPALKQGTVVPINSYWNPQLVSDRTSDKDPNWQNPPQAFGVRQCVVPEPGHVFVSVDYDTVELRSLAQFNYETFGYSMMRERICAGMDLHMALGGKLMGFDYEWGKANKNDPKVKKGRKMAKPTNFGRPGGMGDEKFCVMAKKQYDTIFTLEEAAEHKSIWLAENPEMREFFALAKTETRGGRGTVRTPASGMVRGNCTFPAACNQRFQGRVAYGATDGLFYLSWECYVRVPSHTKVESPLYGSRPQLFLHDENILSIPRTRLHEASLRQTKVMIDSMQRIHPDVPITATPAAMFRWYKESEAVYGDGVAWPKGELMPWELAALDNLVKWLRQSPPLDLLQAA
jgi:hypothetical protein